MITVNDTIVHMLIFNILIIPQLLTILEKYLEKYLDDQ